jgi:acetyl esterase/lipase
VSAVSQETPAPEDDGQPPLPFEAARVYARTVTEWGRQPLPPDVTTWRGLAYGEHPAQRLDVYAPRGARVAPVLVFWHGGGWTNGYREWVAFMAPHVVRRGLVLVAPSYRLVHQARLPAACDDAAAVLPFVRAHAAIWGADAQGLYLSGHSAGGHLAALTALRAGGVRGCLPVSAILDLHHPAPPPGSLEERVYTTVLADPDDDAVLSPLHWTRGNTVPFSLTVGEADSERVRRSNRRMAALLRLQPAPSELVVEAGLDHFATHTALADGGHPWYARLQRLVDATR